jgi:hypothetical protein
MITRIRRSRRRRNCESCTSKSAYLGSSRMIQKVALCAVVLVMLASAYGQNTAGWQCSDDITKVEGDSRRVRVSVGVMETLAQNKTLPDVADLKGKELSSTVILRIIIGKDGAVRCVDPVQGDSDLCPRSVEAARQWRFRPYLLNGQPIMVETRIEFVFKKGNVRDLQAER